MRKQLLMTAVLALAAAQAPAHAGMAATGQTAFVDHTRAAEPGEMVSDAGSTYLVATRTEGGVDHTRAAEPGENVSDAGGAAG